MLIELLIDLQKKAALLIDLRDNIETFCQGPQYANFLNNCVPVFLKILDGNPVFISNSPEQVGSRLPLCERI
jgi:transformation/transcription domain-associated protein